MANQYDDWTGRSADPSNAGSHERGTGPFGPNGSDREDGWRDQDMTAAWVRAGVNQIRKMSDRWRDRDPREIMADIERFARRQPVAFLGGAILLGFVSARMLRSAASSRGSRQRPTSTM